MSDITSDEQAEQMLASLTAYYGEPVMPIKRYCAALVTWKNAVIEGGAEELKTSRYESPLAALGQAASQAFLGIAKSALLSRLLYDGEAIRTKKCPVHKGRWSGCHWGRIECVSDEYPQGCYSGSNVTGWLPNDDTLAAQLRWHEKNGWPMLNAEPRMTIFSI